MVPAEAQTKSKKKSVSTQSTTSKKKVSAKKTTSEKKATIGVPKAEVKRKEPVSSEMPASETTQGVKTVSEPENLPPSVNASITSSELLEFHAQPAGIQKLIESSLTLARQNLTYTFGSADPANGGMDCSGFIYYLLRQHGLTQVPRDSSGLYSWARKARGFRAVVSRKADSFEMDELLPGDFLFWTGTYATENDPPVTHTMIYLGTEKSTGAKVMIGSSNGRTYRGQKRNGVSVFDFKMPRTSSSSEQGSTFIGYARIPGLRDRD